MNTPVQVHETTPVSFTVNGSTFAAEVEPRRSLSDVIRDDIGLTGTHLGCEHGVCGACTILLNGAPARSCLMLALQANSANITTIEGLANGDTLHPVQQAMHEAHGFQCAFCAPGFLMSTVALLAENPSPTRDEIRQELSGNLCRCTGYETILNGVETAVALISNTAPASPATETGETR